MISPNENSIDRITEDNKEEIFSLKHVPEDIVEMANSRFDNLTKNKNAKLEEYGQYGKIIKMTSKAAIYGNYFGPNTA